MIDQAIFATQSVQVGLFRCPADDERFADSGPTETFCFVFPRTSLVIEHQGARGFVADPTVVTLYNRGQSYRRRVISADGDRCDWFALSEAIVREAVGEYDRAASETPMRPLRFAHVPSDAHLYRGHARSHPPDANKLRSLRSFAHTHPPPRSG
jgi:hypothetical protein